MHLLVMLLKVCLVIGRGLGHRTAGVVGDGSGVVFMSARGLPVAGFPGGYPGGGADEVYLFRGGCG